VIEDVNTTALIPDELPNAQKCAVIYYSSMRIGKCEYLKPIAYPLCEDRVLKNM
jgi:hypothetical protein